MCRLVRKEYGQDTKIFASTIGGHEVTEKTVTKRKPRVCSECGSKRIANIEYGLPYLSETERMDVESGKIVLAGCVVSDDDPKWECADCGKQFWRGAP